ncbi:hypothetical protein AKO1_007504 [Acrasis kona]
MVSLFKKVNTAVTTQAVITTAEKRRVHFGGNGDFQFLPSGNDNEQNESLEEPQLDEVEEEVKEVNAVQLPSQELSQPEEVEKIKEPTTAYKPDKIRRSLGQRRTKQPRFSSGVPTDIPDQERLIKTLDLIIGHQKQYLSNKAHLQDAHAHIFNTLMKEKLPGILAKHSNKIKKPNKINETLYAKQKSIQELRDKLQKEESEWLEVDKQLQSLPDGANQRTAEQVEKEASESINQDGPDIRNVIVDVIKNNMLSTDYIKIHVQKMSQLHRIAERCNHELVKRVKRETLAQDEQRKNETEEEASGSIIDFVNNLTAFSQYPTMADKNLEVAMPTEEDVVDVATILKTFTTN